mmetsp:Transcript_22818/g.22051  ORF Transcript_22818/g.22051 Transcript_22818/m.22051 type:complete len:108 (+) Transcript_22818:1739-2062(+)
MPEDLDEFAFFLQKHYLHPNQESPWNLLRQEVLRILKDNVLVKDIVKEVRLELRESAEQCVIQSCQENFKNLLMTGAFVINDKQPRSTEEEVIKERERLCVMSVILH